MKTTAEYSNFEALDLRIGKIVKVESANCKKEAYRMTINFGSEIGDKISIGAFTSYAVEDLIGKNVLCIVNLPPRKMGPEISEVFTLGVDTQEGKISYITTNLNVDSGSYIY